MRKKTFENTRDILNALEKLDLQEEPIYLAPITSGSQRHESKSARRALPVSSNKLTMLKRRNHILARARGRK